MRSLYTQRLATWHLSCHVVDLIAQSLLLQLQHLCGGVCRRHGEYMDDVHWFWNTSSNWGYIFPNRVQKWSITQLNWRTSCCTSIDYGDFGNLTLIFSNPKRTPKIQFSNKNNLSLFSLLQKTKFWYLK